MNKVCIAPAVPLLRAKGVSADDRVGADEPLYGTRTSTVLLLRRDGRATLLERDLDATTMEWTTREHEFEIGGSCR